MTPLYIRQATRDLAKNDKAMARLIRDVGRVSVSLEGDLFTKLARSIVGQQLSTKASISIWNKIVNRIGDGKRLKPEAVSKAHITTLRSCGLSNSKAQYIKNLAKYVLDTKRTNKSFKDKTNEDVISELTQIKGVGRWTAEMYLMFALGRKDVLPVDDLGIRKGFMKVYSLRKQPDAKKMHSLAKGWCGHHTIGCLYLWESIDKW